MDRQHPDIVGCAFGFGAAGTGIGAMLAMTISGVMFGELTAQPIQPAERELLGKVRLTCVYSSIHSGILLGSFFGAVTGIVYAVYKRRWLTLLDARILTTPGHEYPPYVYRRSGSTNGGNPSV